MGDSKLRPPQVSNELQRVINEIYDHLNGIKDSVNQKPSQSTQKPEVGNPGDTRLVQDKNNNYILQVKSDKGWVNSQTMTLDKGK
mgnify:CR=1 FL=1